MSAKSRRVLQVISGWDAVELMLLCALYGLWQLLKISFSKLWRGYRRKYAKNVPPVELSVDPSVGTHCYIKIMGAKYHYVETGPKTGDIVLVLGDAPYPSLMRTPIWARIVQHLTETGHRVIKLDLRGTGGSEGGSRVDLSPPRAVEELHVLLKSLGVSEFKPAVVIGHGIGGMLTWYLVHSHQSMFSNFVVIDAPHPSLYWQHPPAEFCKKAMHFIQWPYLPERWLASIEPAAEGDEQRWANSRACDWSGALNYVRGAAWWRLSTRPVTCRGLLVGGESSASQLIASARLCTSPALRILGSESEMEPVLIDYLIAKDPTSAVSEREWRGGLMGRMLGAVAGRGRELSAKLLPPTPR